MRGIKNYERRIISVIGSSYGVLFTVNAFFFPFLVGVRIIALNTCQRRQITMYNIFAYLELTLVSESLSACGIADDVGLYKECLVGYTVVEDCQIPYLDVPSDAFKIRCTRGSLPTDFC